MAILIYGSGGGEGTSVADTTAVQSDVLPGKYFYLADGTRVEGSMSTKAAATIIPATTNQEINADQYLVGKQTIQGSANLKAENIKDGVNIFGATGNYKGPNINYYTATATTDVHGYLYFSFTVPSGFNIYAIFINTIDSHQDNHKAILAAKAVSTTPIISGKTMSGIYMDSDLNGIKERLATIATVSNISLYGTALYVYNVVGYGAYNFPTGIEYTMTVIGTY
jgi:hypothetical protein